MTKLIIEIVTRDDNTALKHLDKLGRLMSHKNSLTRGDFAYTTSDVDGSAACHVSTMNTEKDS